MKGSLHFADQALKCKLSHVDIKPRRVTPQTYLYSNSTILHRNQIITQLLFFLLNKRIIKCAAMEPLEVRYCVVGMSDLLQGNTRHSEIYSSSACNTQCCSIYPPASHIKKISLTTSVSTEPVISIWYFILTHYYKNLTQRATCLQTIIYYLL